VWEDGKAAAGFKRAASVPASETLTAPPDQGAVARCGFIFLHSPAAGRCPSSKCLQPAPLPSHFFLKKLKKFIKIQPIRVLYQGDLGR
jgi:hypothetical protein